MREIKFRAWHDGNEEMVNFNNSIVKKDHIQASYLAALMDGDFGDVLMQYTDLKDKNGVEVFEGDILGCEKFSLPVKFHEHQGRWFANNNDSYVVWGHKFRLFKVIGNIHQNPELLEVKL